MLQAQLVVALQELTDELSGIGQTRSDIRAFGFPYHPDLKYIPLCTQTRRRIYVEYDHVKVGT